MSESSHPFEFDGQKYFMIPNDLVHTDIVIDFPLSLYMPMNKNVVVLFREGAAPGKQRLSKYRTNGLTNFICPEKFYPNWLKYLERLNASSGSAATTVELSEVGRKIASGTMSRDEKKEYLMSVGQKMSDLLGQIANGDEAAKQEAMEECNKVSKELVQLAMQSHQSKAAYDSLVMLQEGALEHSTAVSTIATIFALSCGFVEDGDLADIAMGCLLHDVGHSQVDVDLFEKSFDKFNPEQKEKFAAHIRAGLDLLAELGEDVPPLVKTIIEMHHERFDGRGFPQGMSGLQIDERVQIIYLADHLDDLMSGAMTGEKLSPIAAFEWMKENEMADPHNQMVSPELFHTVYQTVLKSKPSDFERAS